eukprot:gene14801-14979_t
MTQPDFADSGAYDAGYVEEDWEYEGQGSYEQRQQDRHQRVQQRQPQLHQQHLAPPQAVGGHGTQHRSPPAKRMADQGLLGGDRPAQMPRGVDGRGAGRQQQGRDAGGWSNSGGHYAQPLLPPVHSAATDSPQYGMQQPPQLGRGRGSSGT